MGRIRGGGRSYSGKVSGARESSPVVPAPAPATTEHVADAPGRAAHAKFADAMPKEAGRAAADWRARLHEVIFEADTPAGRTFDIVLLVLITLSVITVMLESVASFERVNRLNLARLDWIFTIAFTVEYILRLLAVKRKRGYMLSFFGIVDLIAILPTYLSLLISGTQALTVVRAIRLLRVFRVLKLGNYLSESEIITRSLQASQRKISVFLFAIVMIVTIIGAVMYVIEGEINEGFSSIPLAMYWAIVTLTTVGFGDITPKTGLGQFISAIVMILGYAVIAVPTGIVTAEIANQSRPKLNTQVCRYCAEDQHDRDAVFCKRCGHSLLD